MLKIYGNSLTGRALEMRASECLKNWEPPEDGVCRNVYLCDSDREKHPLFLDGVFERALTGLLKYDSADLFACMFCGLIDLFYPYGTREDLCIELMMMSSCDGLKVDTGKGITARMAILFLVALTYGIPVEFVPDNAGGEARV